MTLDFRAPRRNSIHAAIREGIVEIIRATAEVGATVHAPGPTWTPMAGPHALEALKVAKVEPTHILAHDATGAAWVIWR